MEKKTVRIRFTKRDTARFVSHLDVMRTIGRAMLRADIPALKTAGYNPRPYLSIPCALSLGYESLCEMGDIELPSDYDERGIAEAMSAVMPDGIKITAAYSDGGKAKDIASAGYRLMFRVEGGSIGDIAELFGRKPLVVEKKSKRSTAETDISELIYDIKTEENGIFVRCAASNTVNLNPAVLLEAVKKYAPHIVIKELCICRTDFYCADGSVFR